MKRIKLLFLLLLILNLGIVTTPIVTANDNPTSDVATALNYLQKFESHLLKTKINDYQRSISIFDSPSDIVSLVEKFEKFYYSDYFPKELLDDEIAYRFYLDALKLLYKGRGSTSPLTKNGWYHLGELQGKGVKSGFEEFKYLLGKKILDENRKNELLEFIKNYDFADPENRMNSGFPPSSSFIITNPATVNLYLELVKNSIVRYLPSKNASNDLYVDENRGHCMPIETDIHNIEKRHQDIIKLKKSFLYPYLAKTVLGPQWKDKIISMETGKAPLCFRDEEQFNQFKSELSSLLAKHGHQEEALFFIGTSTKFFSYNPKKGKNGFAALSDNPSKYSEANDELHYFDKNRANGGELSDLDIHLYSPSLSKQCHDRGAPGAFKDRISYFDIATTVDSFVDRYNNKKVPGCGATYLQEFVNKWQQLLGNREIHFSVPLYKIDRHGDQRPFNYTSIDKSPFFFKNQSDKINSKKSKSLFSLFKTMFQ